MFKFFVPEHDFSFQFTVDTIIYFAKLFNCIEYRHFNIRYDEGKYARDTSENSRFCIR